MRNFKVFLNDLIRKPPFFFPLVGVFHLLWLAWIIWDDRYVPIFGIERLQILWILGYTVFWFAACDLRKWGALGYIFLTVVDVALNVAVRNHKVSELYMSNMFLVDVTLSFILILYYKKFSKKMPDEAL